MRRSLVFAVTLVLAGAAGCSKVKEKIAEKVAEKVAEKATGKEVDLGSSSGSVTFRDPKTGAKAELGQASLPEGWPSSAPIYPGATIVTSFSSPKGKQVAFTTKDSVEKVHAFYKSKLPGKQEASLDFGTNKTLAFKDGKTSYMVTIGSTDEGTTTHLLVGTPD